MPSGIIFYCIILCLGFVLSTVSNKFDHQYAVEYAWLAAVGYCSPLNVVSNTCCKEELVANGWEIVHNEETSIDGITGTVLINDKRREVLATFTGTKSKYQLMKEFFASMREFESFDENHKEMKLMSYFKSVYDDFKIRNKDTLNEKLNFLSIVRPNYQFVFVGHSLGGALATIFASEFGSKLKTVDSPVLLTYASPRVGNFAFANAVMKNVPIVFRIAAEVDPVPKIPLCHVDKDFICQNSFNTTEFRTELEITELNLKDSYAWHTGGLVLYSDQFTNYIECGSMYGENHPENDNCDKLSVYKESFEYLIEELRGVKIHGFYFINPKMSAYCSKSLKNELIQKLLK